MNKGQLMKLVYSEEELRNIDAGLPIEYWKGPNKLDNTYWYVMNYNEPNRMGKLEDMRVIAKERNIVIPE